jgi:hypothetical protein
MTGTLISVFANHFKNRRKGYLLIIKNVIAIALIFVAVLLSALLNEFNQSRLFVWPVSWLISAAAMCLIVLALAFYVREYYRSRPVLKVRSQLKFAALVPLFIVVAAVGYIIWATAEHEDVSIEKRFSLNDAPLNIELDDTHPQDQFVNHIRYNIITSASAGNELVLHLEYSGEGRNSEVAKQNIRAMDYYYSVKDNTLYLNEYWTLKEGTLNREQYLGVVVEVPQNFEVISSRPLLVNRNTQSYQYESSGREAEHTAYFSNGQYLYNYGDEFANKLSRNERTILNHKFCEEYFISESWGCDSNIQKAASDNYRFDQAFSQDIESIDKIREYLLPDRTLFVSNLVDMNDLVASLSIEYPVMSEFQAYIEQVLRIKSMKNKTPEIEATEVETTQEPEATLSPD